jgi:hypothetical protein
LAEIKHQWESKPLYTEPLAHRKLLHTMLHWENKWAATAATTGSKPACKTFGTPNRWVLSVMQKPPRYPWDKPAQALGRLTSPAKKPPWTINSELYPSTQWKGQDHWKFTREGGRGREIISPQTISKQTLERQEGWQQAGDKWLLEAGQVADHNDHLLSQWAAPKVKLLQKIEKQTANYPNTLTLP